MALTILFIAKIRPYVVKTGSMEPAIPVHSLCFVNENVTLSSISVGDVISFRAGEDLLVTHRVVEINGGEYTTRGDANNADDASPVTDANYIGKTFCVIPKIGVIPGFLHTTSGKSIACTIVLILLILSSVPVQKNDVPG